MGTIILMPIILMNNYLKPERLVLLYIIPTYLVLLYIPSFREIVI